MPISHLIQLSSLMGSFLPLSLSQMRSLALGPSEVGMGQPVKCHWGGCHKKIPMLGLTGCQIRLKSSRLSASCKTKSNQ